MPQPALEQMIGECLDPSWEFGNGLYAAVAALMIKDAKGGKTHFALGDAKRYVFRACNAPDAETFFEEWPTVEPAGRRTLEHVRKVRYWAGIAKKSNPSLSEEELENIVLLDSSMRHVKGGEAADILGICLSHAATDVLAHLKKRTSVPYLDVSEDTLAVRSATNRPSIAYRLIF